MCYVFYSNGLYLSIVNLRYIVALQENSKYLVYGQAIYNQLRDS